MKYRCSICGYIYDESKEQVLFKDLSDDWVCPLCGAAKALFEPIVEDEVKVEKPKKEVAKPVFENNDVEVTPRELSLVMSNLARGCEKQYKLKEQEKFLELKKYFDDIKSDADYAKVEDLITELKKDLDERYKYAFDTATNEADRGALRALTWSTKVNTMLKSLVEKYEREGSKMLEGKHIYVCTICGFVFIGDKAPELCPVCKVPNFKFEEVA